MKRRRALQFEFVDEFRINAVRREEVRQLLSVSFTEASFARSRTYLKQIPQRRLLVFEDDSLLAHMGLEHRLVGTQEGPASIFGVIDLCVAPAHRGRGIATEILDRLSSLGRESSIEFLMLFAHDARLSERSGFTRQKNPLRWLKINEHESLGLGEEPLERARGIQRSCTHTRSESSSKTRSLPAEIPEARLGA